MRNASKSLVGIVLVAGIIGLGILLGWWGSRQKGAPAIRPAAETALHTAPAPANSPPLKPVEPAAPERTAAGRPQSPAPTNTAAASASADWEDRLDDILSSDDEDTNKVARLFAMFPRLPEEGQEEVAQHLSNLVPDEDYAPLGQMLQNAKLAEPVLDVLMSDLLDRPDSIKLPALLQVAQNPNHPKVDEAKDLMELYLDEEDQSKWPDKMKQYLKENPD